MPIMTLELEIITRKPYGTVSVDIVEFDEASLAELSHDEKILNSPEMLSRIKVAVFAVLHGAGVGFIGE